MNRPGTRVVRGRMRLAAGALLSTALVLATGAVPAPTEADFDLTGEWILTVESPNGTGTREVTFVQEDDVLSGTISSTMATGPLTGRVNQEDATVTFTASVSMGSGDFDIVYLATYSEGKLVDGIVDFGDYGEGTFEGERKPDDSGR